MQKFISVSARPGRFGATVYTELFRRHGLAAHYEARIAPANAHELAELMKREGLSGCSVSMPLKREILPFLNGASPTVQATRSCNTVVVRDGRLWGDNTDVDGVRGALASVQVSRVLIYGYGGVLGSLVTGLREKGVREIAITGRNAGKAEAAAREWAVLTSVERPELVVVAAPLTEVSAELKNWVSQAYAVFELAVASSPVRELAGARYVPGVEMAIHQLVRQFTIYTGLRTSAGEVREIVRQAGLQ